MKSFIKLLFAVSFIAFLFSSCSEGKVELEMSEIAEKPVGDVLQTGYNKGLIFAQGINAMKDTVDMAYDVYFKGAPLDTFTFKGKISKAISLCESPYFHFQQETKDSSNDQWKEGFYNAIKEKTGQSEQVIDQIIEIYSKMNFDNILDNNNMEYVIQIGTKLGAYRPRISNK